MAGSPDAAGVAHNGLTEARQPLLETCVYALVKHGGPLVQSFDS